MRIGIAVPKSGVAKNLIEAQAIREEVRPLKSSTSFTLGGSGGATASYNREEFNEPIAHAESGSRGIDRGIGHRLERI